MAALLDSLSPLRQEADFVHAFRVRVPVPAAPKVCLILLHGAGSDETGLAELASGADDQTLVVLPRGPFSLGASQFGWFQVLPTTEVPHISGKEADASRRSLIQFVAQLQVAYRIAPERTFIAGFSQGGVMSASVALSAPERVRGFGILSGRILPELAPAMATRERLMSLQGFVGHGESDSTLPVAWAHKSDHWLTELGVPHETCLYPMGHEIGAELVAGFLAWLEKLATA